MRGLIARPADRGYRGTIFPLALVAALVVVPGLAADEKADRAAADMLAGARRAYAEKNYPAAGTRFREFLTRFPDHAEVPAARYGLALTLLHSAEPDYKGALEQLRHIAGEKRLPEHPFILYYLGLAERGLGIKEMSRTSKPEETAAKAHFREALKHFTAASRAFAAQVQAPPAPDRKDLPADLEWAARARCDQAEMQLRLQQVQEARTTAADLLKDPLLSRSRARELALYYHGFASFLLHDYLAAGRSLNLLTPFADPAFGPHARYLLARVYHLTDERAKAAGHYEGVLVDYEKHKAAALKMLQRPDTFKNEPSERARLEALTKDPPPDHVGRATFFLGLLLSENGRFGEAQARLADFTRRYPKSPLWTEARLHLGLCQVQLKQYAEAVGTLQPLADKEPRLADQALLWLGKAQVGAANPENVPAHRQALKTALDTFQRAADKARALAETDAEARTLYGDIVLELADTQQLAGQYKEAAATYAQLLKDHSLPPRDEEVQQRQLTALHLAGDYRASDQACARFQQLYPDSTLLPSVLFRHAENAFFLAIEAEKDAALPDRNAELARRSEEAARRYETVVDRFPNFEYGGLARYRLALTFLQKGDLEKAKDLLTAIPGPDCTGDLALVPYLQADCLIRLAPTQVDDALAAGRLEEQLQSAVQLLDGFVNAQPKSPQTPGALLRLGLCQQRLAVLLVKPEERAQGLANARATYEKLIQQFPGHEAQQQALFEKAKWRTLRNQPGDLNKAIDELRRFTSDPLKKSAIAPLAYLQLATFLRSQHKAAEAVEVLAQCRRQYEAELLKSPDRAAWVALLQYHHGVALQEAGKLSEARTVLEGVSKQFPTRPEAAEAALHCGLCLKAEGMQRIDKAQSKDEGLRLVRDAAVYLEKQAGVLKEKQPAAEVRARLLYEAAWAYRILAAAEVAAAGGARRDEPRAEIPVAKVSVQPAERKARALYQELIAAFPDLPLANDARLELAEVYAERAEYDAAMPLLQETLVKEIPPELADKVRLRLGACLERRGDAKAALEQFDVVARNAKSPLVGQARYRAGECQLRRGDWGTAVKQLAVFRDQEPFRNLPGLTDRALLRLGHALAELRQWDQSRQAFEQLISRFGNSRWVPEARYGIGWAYQKTKQYDQAVNAYTAAVATKASAVAGRAQLQVGLCRLEQKRYPEAVKALRAASEHDDPEVKAIALVEAAWAHAALKQRDEADKLLRQVLRDHAGSKAAAVAKERLKALPDAVPPPRKDLLAGASWSAPEVQRPMSLPMLGQPQASRASIGDPTGEASLALALAAPPPGQKTPAPFLRLNLPDPFEHRHAPRRVIPAESDVPSTVALRWPRP
jgi:TolA-binding protein